MMFDTPGQLVVTSMGEIAGALMAAEPEAAGASITTTATQLGPGKVPGRLATEMPATPAKASEAELRNIARRRAFASKQDIGFDVAQAAREEKSSACDPEPEGGDAVDRNGYDRGSG